MDKQVAQELRMLGEGIRQYRRALGVSQEDFAEICDLHRTYIGQIERGEKNISFVNISKIARALKIKPSLLLSSSSL